VNVAISGDRSSCLTHELAPGAYVFALARGCGQLDGTPVAAVVLARMRSDLDRRLRGDRLPRAQRRVKGMFTLLTAAFGKVNAEIYARSDSNEDYVTSVCSLTGALLLGNRVYLAHAGSTAAYLARDGAIVSLTKNDAFDAPTPVLTRALGAAPAIEVSVASFSLNEGDSLVLAGRRYTAAEERLRQWESEQSLVVQFSTEPAPAIVAAPRRIVHPFFTSAFATLIFYAMLCLR
jgi:hypothetical protein